MINELKEKLAELAELEAISDKMNLEWEADPLSEEKEAAFDKAYTEQWNKFNEIQKELYKITDGQIDMITARKMLQERRNDVIDIIEKFADKGSQVNDRNRDVIQAKKADNPMRHNISHGGIGR